MLKTSTALGTMALRGGSTATQTQQWDVVEANGKQTGISPLGTAFLTQHLHKGQFIL